MARASRTEGHGSAFASLRRDKLDADKSPVGGGERTGRSAHARRPRALAVVRQSSGRWTEELRLK
jgi:hypothetical protein